MDLRARPHGYTGNATEAIITQIERFAPGFRDRITGKTVRSTVDMAVYNPNYVGGDIVTGAKDIRQLVLGPRITLTPYHVGVPGMYVCSAATPPGPGAHGMCGANAAKAALHHLAGHAWGSMRGHPPFTAARRPREEGGDDAETPNLDTVEEERDRFADVRVHAFVPILVERSVRSRLRG